MTNTNEITTTSSDNKCPMLQSNKRVIDSGGTKMELDIDIDPDKGVRGNSNNTIVQLYPPLSYNTTNRSSLQSNSSRTEKASNQCDLLSQPTSTVVSSESNNLGDTQHAHLSSPPPTDSFRRPSYPVYFPSQHFSPARPPYKRPISSPLYLPTDIDYYPSNIIAQSCRRRRSTTPPFKEYKRFTPKFHHLHPPNISNEIWSIPREVQIVLVVLDNIYNKSSNTRFAT